MVLNNMDESMSKDNLEIDDQALTDDDMRPEYDFSEGIRGKHFQAYRQGHTVQVYQPDAESVNRALRGLIALVPKTPLLEKQEEA